MIIHKKNYTSNSCLTNLQGFSKRLKIVLLKAYVLVLLPASHLAMQGILINLKEYKIGKAKQNKTRLKLTLCYILRHVT